MVHDVEKEAQVSQNMVICYLYQAVEVGSR